MTFEDENLEKAIRQEINKPDCDILKSDVEEITELRTSFCSITNITGIENLCNSTDLGLFSN